MHLSWSLRLDTYSSGGVSLSHIRTWLMGESAQLATLLRLVVVFQVLTPTDHAFEGAFRHISNYSPHLDTRRPPDLFIVVGLSGNRLRVGLIPSAAVEIMQNSGSQKAG
jgi:hypothetical protein